ncbi:hypothetical protein PGT21_016695 [Puccinia graminis f. sp. tritici]|uniref:Uncharacterized protein n=2 Tax=Puccinia graminis f. sp. tritici TaxID=56615 RepID=E3L1H2_PUCGT|nr:uncharacterized protein PGTG_16157 [Puccinia graminis f. sp. tritici CRL 75-36-700-3]EFP90397.2 hypothetical protein PGTG_16157 [Puccinia graminis f. sp. tritici CRL 75-36-700-3]KAA1074710.1 hypothetical protein PGT21_016695 [Puccinia graminis f. sp. tritici]
MKLQGVLLRFLGSFWLVSTLTRAIRTGREQIALSSSNFSAYKTENSNLIFSSFAGLLQQWPNSFAFSGHSIIPGLIPRSTLLYHATNNINGPPTGIEWLAFNSEMSYSILSHRGGELDLYKYAATRPLRVLYVDGQSASLGTPGFMDSQYIIIDASIPPDNPDPGHDPTGETARAVALCKMGEKYGFEGVVRMATSFELLWCDFKNGIELLNMTNATDPYYKHQWDSDVPTNSLERDQSAISDSADPPFFARARWTYAHSGAREFFAPGEVRVILDPMGFISFYDGLESLDAKRRVEGTSEGPRARHRLYGISAHDTKKVQARLIEVLERKEAEDWQIDSHRPDWRALVLTIIQRYSQPLIELRYLLNREDLNATEQAIEVRGLTYDILMPSLDFSHWSSPERDWISEGIHRCLTYYTSTPLLPSDLTHSIRLIIGAIEGTLKRVCTTIYTLFFQTIQMFLPVEPTYS